MKLLINIIAIIVVAVVIGFQFNRTKNLYNKNTMRTKTNSKKIRNNKTKSILSKRAAIMAALKHYQLLIISY